MPQHSTSLITSSAGMVCLAKSSVTGTHVSLHYSGSHYSNVSIAKSTYPQHFTHRQMGNQRGSTAQLSRYFVPMCLLSRMTGMFSCHKCLLHLIHLSMLARRFHPLNAFMASNHQYHLTMHLHSCRILKCNLSVILCIHVHMFKHV